jgi:hypothetical protein
MNKKIIFILSFILMVSFSAGVFVQLVTTEQVSLSADDVSFIQGLWSGCKSDILMTACAMVLSVTVYTVPFLMLLVTGQVFTLGFSAAWLLSAHPQGLPIVCTVLLPRCLIKLPAYLALILLSLQSAKSRRKQKRQKLFLQPYLICLAALMLSSLLEAVLHLLIVSP